MTFEVPTYTAPSGSWRLVDWLDQSWQATAGGDGTATITLDPLDPAERWRITRSVVSSTSSSSTSVRHYLGSVATGNLRSGSNTGNYDEADYPAGLMIPPTGVYVTVWTGCTPGASCTLALQADILRND